MAAGLYRSYAARMPRMWPPPRRRLGASPVTADTEGQGAQYIVHDDRHGVED